MNWTNCWKCGRVTKEHGECPYCGRFNTMWGDGEMDTRLEEQESYALAKQYELQKFREVWFWEDWLQLQNGSEYFVCPHCNEEVLCRFNAMYGEWKGFCNTCGEGRIFEDEQD